jgi:quinol monooxygenase YgiN
VLQKSKLIRSRDEWKDKAVQRSYEIREHRKRYFEQIAGLKARVREMSQAEEDKKTLLNSAIQLLK